MFVQFNSTLDLPQADEGRYDDGEILTEVS